MTLKELREKVANIPDKYDEFDVLFMDGYGCIHLDVSDVQFDREERGVVISQKKSKYGRYDR